MLNIVNEAKEIQNEIVKNRRFLHQIPEVGHLLPKTSKYVADTLLENHIEFKKNLGDSGIVGIIKGKKPGKVIALRADMDALPIIEDTQLSFSSKNENMHACGHDSHTAMLLGAAKILNHHKDELSGTIKLIFQTDEEGCQGAKIMIDEGVLDNPRVDSILGLHIGTIFKEIECGHIGISYGPLMASFDKFSIKIKGHGCHGAMPHTGVDPIVIAGQVITALQTIVSRENKATQPAVLTIGKIQGGTAYNIIPNEVILEGTIRAVDQEQRSMIEKRINEIVSGIATALRGDCEFKMFYGAPPVINDGDFTKEFVQTASKVIGEENITLLKKPTMGGEDMAFYLNKVPGTFFFLGAGNEEKGITYPHHNPKFDIDEDVLWKGSALLAQGAIDWLEKNK